MITLLSGTDYSLRELRACPRRCAAWVRALRAKNWHRKTIRGFMHLTRETVQDMITVADPAKLKLDVLCLPPSDWFLTAANEYIRAERRVRMEEEMEANNEDGVEVEDGNGLGSKVSKDIVDEDSRRQLGATTPQVNDNISKAIKPKIQKLNADPDERITNADITLLMESYEPRRVVEALARYKSGGGTTSLDAIARGNVPDRKTVHVAVGVEVDSDIEEIDAATFAASPTRTARNAPAKHRAASKRPGDPRRVQNSVFLPIPVDAIDDHAAFDEIDMPEKRCGDDSFQMGGRKMGLKRKNSEGEEEKRPEGRPMTRDKKAKTSVENDRQLEANENDILSNKTVAPPQPNDNKKRVRYGDTILIPNEPEPSKDYHWRMKSSTTHHHKQPNVTQAQESDEPREDPSTHPTIIHIGDKILLPKDELEEGESFLCHTWEVDSDSDTEQVDQLEEEEEAAKDFKTGEPLVVWSIQKGKKKS
ncbi:hypothetical protein H0H87_001083 [Tephrocybe sp. NHM501043]|nr:hypothetical protein H0H87_001083 [Tephrocybe sp. NHM501043]